MPAEITIKYDAYGCAEDCSLYHGCNYNCQEKGIEPGRYALLPVAEYDELKESQRLYKLFLEGKTEAPKGMGDDCVTIFDICRMPANQIFQSELGEKGA